MDFFFKCLKQCLVALSIVVFVFTVTYVPHHLNQVEKAHAGPYGLEITQILNVAKNAITAAATTALEVKEYAIDHAAWAFARGLLQTMVMGLTDWIRSGFKGRPQFVENLRNYLTEVADATMGDFVSDVLGTDFICSPFRIDIAIDLDLYYREIQRERGERPYGECRLSGIIDNLDGFLSGTRGAFSSQGGWDDWFDVTAQPMVYTEYGSTLSAKSGLRAAIINAEGEEQELLDWGDGTFSIRYCVGEGGDIEFDAESKDKDCKVGTPGKLIADSLTRNMDSGRESMILADEIIEPIINAFLDLLFNTALSGVRGLMQ
jgi:hypothetical protein